jgi:hypothetical protein
LLRERGLALSAIVTESIHWEDGSTPSPRQGEILRKCLVPVLPEDIVFGTPTTIDFEERDLITVTQSCDLKDMSDTDDVALCPVHSMSAWEEMDPQFARKNEWENVRKKRRKGIYLLPPLPGDSRGLVVDFRGIVSLSARYVRKHAAELGTRHRLKSPFREDFSGEFGAFFSRVALPGDDD